MADSGSDVQVPERLLDRPEFCAVLARRVDGQWRVKRAELKLYIAGLYEAARSGPGPGPEAADSG